MEAVGNVDADATLDRWTSTTDVNNGSPLQTTMDSFNFDYVTVGVVADPPAGVAPLVRELAVIQKRARTARPVLEALRMAEEIYKQGHGTYLHFETLTPEVAQDGKIVLHAKGNVDPDSAIDTWTLHDGGSPQQDERDWMNLAE